MSDGDYWLPSWWFWMDEAEADIPPGLLAMAQLVGGGTETVCGNLVGNTQIASSRQAAAVNRMTGGRVGSVNVRATQRQVDQIDSSVRNQRGATLHEPDGW